MMVSVVINPGACSGDNTFTDACCNEIVAALSISGFELKSIFSPKNSPSLASRDVSLTVEE